MHIDPNDQRETLTLDGGDLTEEEARLYAEGVEEKTDDDTGGSGDDKNNDTTDEATRAAQEAAATAAATKTQDTATATATAAAAVELPAKPEPPKDFDAVNAANEQAYNDGEIDAVELNKRTRELTLEQIRYERQVEDYDRQVASIQDSAKQRAEDDWNTTAVAFEAANKDFLSNPLRHKVMQDSLSLVLGQAQAKGEAITDQQALDRALAVAIDYTGWQPPKTTTSQEERDAVGKALADRQVEKPGKTLGDMPTSRTEEIRGNEAFASMDALPTEQHEEAFANMTPAQQERYLREAPGATANGRGND